MMYLWRNDSSGFGIPYRNIKMLTYLSNISMKIFDEILFSRYFFANSQEMNFTITSHEIEKGTAGFS